MSDLDRESTLTGTSRRIRGAIEGDRSDVEWIVGRLTPVLIQQARYRMKDRLRRVCDPEDVVSYAWDVSLPRLTGLVARDGRYSPVLLKFLSTAILLRVNELLRREAARPEVRHAAATDAPGSGAASVSRIEDPSPGVWTEVIRRERRGLVLSAIEDLDPPDREVIVLRLVEQLSAAQAGSLLGLEPNTVNVRLHRALARLRSRLPDSIFDDLAAETG